MTFLESNAWGHGLATIAADGTVLDVLYPNPQLGDAPKTDALWVVPKELDAMVGTDERRRVSTQVVRTEVDLTAPVSSTADAYLRLLPPNPATMMQEAIEEQVATIDYNLKANKRAALKFFEPRR